MHVANSLQRKVCLCCLWNRSREFCFLDKAEAKARRRGRQRKRWEDNIREWTGLEFAKSQRAVENREKMEETGCEIICGAPTTLAVKR